MRGPEEREFTDRDINGPVRLNKYISECGICSRREADRLIGAGEVTVDGSIAVSGMKVLPGQEVKVKGKRAVREEEMVILAFHKPAGVMKFMKRERILAENWYLEEQGSAEQMEIPAMPMQVHDILYHHGRIGDSYRWGKTTDCRWVNDKTWIYRTEFELLSWGADRGEYLLFLEGLDTFAEIRVNGESAGRHNDCYLPCRLDISSLVQPGKNTLEIIFSPVKEALKKAEEKYSSVLAEKMVDSCRFLRKTFHDFTTYLGNDPDFYKVGVFGKVILFEIPDRLQIDGMDVEYSLNETLDTAKVQIHPKIGRAHV